MTNAQAAKLQLKWKLRVPFLSCPHHNKEFGCDEQGDLTGPTYCLICGEEFGGPSLLATP